MSVSGEALYIPRKRTYHGAVGLTLRLRVYLLTQTGSPPRKRRRAAFTRRLKTAVPCGKLMERNLKTLFDYECKRQPTLAALVAKINTLTEADIAITPVKLPWMRTALLQLKRDKMAESLAKELEPLIVDGVVGDDIGWMRTWVESSMFISIGRTRLEMHPGQLIWLGATGMWIDTIFVAQVPPEVFTCSRSVSQVRRSEYYQAVRKRVNGLSAPVLNDGSSKPAFHIYRPA